MYNALVNRKEGVKGKQVHPTSYRKTKPTTLYHTMSTIDTTAAVTATSTSTAFEKINEEVEKNILGPNAWDYNELRARITDHESFLTYSFAIARVYGDLAHQSLVDGEDNAKRIAYSTIANAIYSLKYNDDSIRVLSDALRAHYTITHSVTISYLSGLPEGESETLEIDLLGELVDFEDDIKRNIRKARRLRNYTVEITEDSDEYDEVDFQRKSAIYGVAILNVIADQIKDCGRPIDYLAYSGAKCYVEKLIDPFSTKEECVRVINAVTKLTVSLLSL